MVDCVREGMPCSGSMVCDSPFSRSRADSSGMLLCMTHGSVRQLMKSDKAVMQGNAIPDIREVWKGLFACSKGLIVFVVSSKNPVKVTPALQGQIEQGLRLLCEVAILILGRLQPGVDLLQGRQQPFGSTLKRRTHLHASNIQQFYAELVCGSMPLTWKVAVMQPQAGCKESGPRLVLYAVNLADLGLSGLWV